MTTFIDFNFIFNIIISILTCTQLYVKTGLWLKNCKQWDFHSVYDLHTSKIISSTSLKKKLIWSKHVAVKWRFSLVTSQRQFNATPLYPAIHLKMIFFCTRKNKLPWVRFKHNKQKDSKGAKY
jgi:hypothetical protein